MRKAALLSTANGRRLSVWTVLRLLLIALFCTSASALDRERAISQFHHTSWRASDGAPSQISALAQTTDGYLWIGSARGLFRFDGVRFEPYEPPGVNLPSHNIYALMATSDGGLWVSFRPSGLGFLRDGQMTVFERAEELPQSQVYCFAHDSEGRIWAGTHEGLALRVGSGWVPIGRDWNFTPQRIRTLFVDRDGTLWVATDDAIVFLTRGSKAFQSTGTRVGIVTRITQAKDGRLWIAEALRGARPLPMSRQDSDGQSSEIWLNAQEVLLDRDGGLWITDLEGLKRVRFPEQLGKRDLRPGNPELESFLERDGLSGDLVNILLEDREGNIWVSTAKGLDRFRHSHLVPVTLPNGFQKLTLLAGGHGDVWANSATDRPILHISGEEQILQGPPWAAASLFQDPGGDIWWGGYGGILRQRNQQFESFPQPKETTTDWAWEIFKADDQGGLWVSLGDVGLIHFKDGVWTRSPKPIGLPDRGPSATHRERSGRLWLGYTENRVCSLDGQTVRCYSQDDGLVVGRIKVIRGQGPNFWFGGELGLALFTDGRFYAVKGDDAAPFGAVSGIVETADGSLWLNEMRGVVRITPEEIRQLVADPNHAVVYQRFDFLDGLPGGAQMNFTTSTAVEASDGKIWFATDNGLVWINPAQIAKNTVPPPVAIHSINSGEERHTGLDEVRFGVGTKNVEFDYTAMSLSIPERVLFRYKLEGVDEGWQDASTRRRASYNNLRPGQYRFRVIASNNDGLWNEEGASVAFSIAPAFYQTNWFILLCLAVAGFLTWIGYQWRVRQVASRLHMQFNERISERTRIAQDLHDTLLQGLLSASMQLHIADERLSSDSPAKPLVGRVLELMGQVVDEGRNAVRGLRASGSDLRDLEQSFAKIKEELALPDTGDLKVVVNGGSRPLHPVIRDEVYRIGREALVNAFRHSQASRIEVQLEFTGKDLRLLVRDNGCGIDPGVVLSGREGHWGLSGMRERANEIGGKLRVLSRTGAGTEVELIIPSHIAFESDDSHRKLGWLSRLHTRKAKDDATIKRETK